MERPRGNRPGADAVSALRGLAEARSTTAVHDHTAIADFWAWWTAGGGRRMAKALDRRRRGEVAQALNTLVAEIDPGLDWEIAPTIGGMRRLTVTAAGRAELRCIARRWLAGAPTNDPNWRFADLLGPSKGRALLFKGNRVDFEDAWVQLLPGTVSYRAAVTHPLMAVLEPADRADLARALLDAVAGEMAVDSWISSITAAEAVSDASICLEEVPEKLVELSLDNLGADLEPNWQIVQGVSGGQPMVAMVRVPLVSISRPECDAHVLLEVPYVDDSECGLPGSGSLPQLRDFEDRLTDLVCDDGECVAAETAGGIRRLHFYVDSTTDAARILREEAVHWDQGEVQVSVSLDPAWSEVAYLRM